MAVGRGIRLVSSLPVPPEPSASLPRLNDLLCSQCGRVVCEGPRAKLFAGMVLRCNACGTSVRVTAS